jgi:hypothetical protein
VTSEAEDTNEWANILEREMRRVKLKC